MDNIHITKSKDHSSDKIIIREEENERSQKPTSQLSNVSFKTASRYQYVENSAGKKVKIRTPRPETEQQIAEPEKIQSPHFFLEVTEDNLKAYLLVQKRIDNPYTKEEILEYLKANGIVYGIREKVLSNILEGKCYYEEVLIAKGISPVDGKDGYYDFSFNTNPTTKPIILSDGSVDYNTLGRFEITVKDQLLATYHPAIPHKDGMDVYGRVIKAVVEKELPKLTGKGFDYEPEEMEYYSNREGKVTYEKGELNVIPVFIVDNLDAATGDLSFQGDILVNGNVFSNVTVKATGNITVNGHVEIATLIAGKDVLLKNGMQGSGSGRIYAKGNVMAKFLEQTIVQTNGTVSANAILNCTVFSGKSVSVSGTRGSIIGGSVTAVEEIQASTIGNRTGIDTKLVIGIEEDYKIAMEKIDKEIELCSNNLKNLQLELNNLSIQNQYPAVLLNQKKELEQQQNELQLNINRLNSRKEHMTDIRERSLRGKIVVSGIVHAGTRAIMNGLCESLSSEYKNVTFHRSPREIRIISNSL